MSSIFCQYKVRNKDNYLSIDEQLINISSILDKLSNENHLFKTRFDRLDERYQQWIDDERIFLLKRIEKLEHDNHQLLELYHTYQIESSKSLQSIMNLVLKILLIQQELRKQSIERHNVNDPAQRQQNGTTRSLSCPLTESRYTINDQSIWLHQDRKTTNYSSELANHSSTLATVKSKTDRSATAQSNKLYYVLNNEKPVSTRSTGINIVPVDNSNINSHRKQQTSVTFNKNPLQTRSAYSNHQRLPTQTSQRTPTKITTPRVPTITTNTRSRPPLPPTNQKTTPSSSTTNKSSARPRYALPKSTEPPPPPPTRSVGATTPPRPGQKTTKPNISPTKNVKTRIPVVPQQSARVTDLDTAIAERQKKTLKLCERPKIITPPKLIQPKLFSKDSVKHIRPVRSRELKIFSCHLTPEVSVPKNESSSTLTPSSYESIHDHPCIEKQNDDRDISSNISGVVRDFSADSLNEHHHIQPLLQRNSATIESDKTAPTTKQSYFLSVHDEDSNPPYARSSSSSSLIKPKPSTTVVHRLVFPERLGRLIFHRRILSESDIYQKNCSKDQEIRHNVYHLDTVRDYSMEFYMLTTYASDSQLRAWLEGDDDDDVDDDQIEGQYNENRFLSSDEEMTKKKGNSSDSLIPEGELDWCSELELINLNNSTENHLADSSDLTSTSWSVPAGASNHLHSTPLPSNSIDGSNLLLQEILNHSWIEHLSSSNSIEQETGIEQLENDSTSSIIADEFQRDFYYLCPITKTTSFSKTDSKT